MYLPGMTPSAPSVRKTRFVSAVVGINKPSLLSIGDSGDHNGCALSSYVLKLYSEDEGKVMPFPPVQPIKAQLGGACTPGS